VITNEGQSTVYFNSTDKAGNTETVKSAVVRIAYSVTFSVSGLPEGCSWSVTLGDITVSCADMNTTLKVVEGEYNWNVSELVWAQDGYQYVASSASGTLNVPIQLSQGVSYSVSGIPMFWWTMIALGLVPFITFIVIGAFVIRRRWKARRDKTPTVDETKN
jgi:hypothetical protein